MVYRIFALIAISLVLVSGAHAGGSIFSPNGIGEECVGGGVRAQGLGGGAVGLADSMSFNTRNPALAAFVQKTTTRISGEFGTWSTAANGSKDTDTEFLWKDFCIYFPVMRTWRFGIGAEPSRHMDLRTFGNHRAEFYEPSGDTAVSRYEERDVWQGSTVEWRLDNVFRIGERWALGVSAAYVTLHNERERTLDMEEIVRNSYYFDVYYHEVERFTGWSVVGGLLYKPAEKWGLGATFRPRTSGHWTYTMTKSGTNAKVKRNRRGDLPGEVRAGGSYLFNKRLVGVADVQLGQWSAGDLGIMADSAALAAPENPLFISAGIERLAGRPPFTTGLGNWGFRGGVFYRKHYWPLHNGAAVEDIGLAAGISFPMEGSKSWLHGAVEGGVRGLDKDKLEASETFLRLSLQVELGETWFQRSHPRIPK